jgi:anti-anti-sigma factor
MSTAETNKIPSFTTSQQRTYLVVEFQDEMLMGEIPLRQLQTKLEDLAETNAKMVLDLRKVKMVSSRFLGLLTGLHQKLNRAKGKLVVCGLNEQLTELMMMTRLSKVIPVVKSVGDVVERDAFL